MRNGVDSLPRVISLENIIDTYRGGSRGEIGEHCDATSVPCQLCQSEQPLKAVKSCLDCNASYCRKCLKISHPEKLPFSEHQLVEPKQHPKPRKQLCPTHGEKLNIYCQDCETLGCLLCADADHDDQSSHHGHQILSLQQAMQLLKVGCVSQNLLYQYYLQRLSHQLSLVCYIHDIGLDVSRAGEFC